MIYVSIEAFWEPHSFYGVRKKRKVIQKDILRSQPAIFKQLRYKKPKR